MNKEKATGNYDLELMVTRKRDEDGNTIGFEAKGVTCKEQDHSSVGQALGAAIQSDVRQMLEQSKFQESLLLFAKTGPTRPVVLWVGLERVFRRGRVKRGPGKGRMRTLRRFDRYKDPKQAEYFKKFLEPRPWDYSVPSIGQTAPEGEYVLPTVPPELLRGDVYFASEMVARHKAPRTILDGVKDESENL